jgi:hypothetical protein
VLAGFALFLVIGLLRMALGLKVLGTVTAGATRTIILQIVRYGFILALVALLCGFGLAFYRAFLNSGPPTPSRRIEPLKEPKSLSVPASSSTAQPQTVGPAPGRVKAPAKPTKRLASAHPKSVPAPAAAKPVPRATQILEGKSDSLQRRVFDILIENPSDSQITLDTFDTSWQYLRGSLAAVQEGEIVVPKSEHSIKLQIDPLDSSRKSHAEPIQPTIVLPAGSPQAPSVYKLRLEVLYTFSGSTQEHPSTDWNIQFTVSIKTTGSQTIPIFRDTLWR